MKPEAKTNKLIDALLEKYDIRPAKKAGTFTDASGWYFKPPGSAYGTKGIPDYMGHFHGVFWAVESKAVGKQPSGFQSLQIQAVKCSGGKVFVVDGPESLQRFERWLWKTKKWVEASKLYNGEM